MRFHSENIAGSHHFATFYDSLTFTGPDKERQTARFLGITVQTLRRYLSGKVQPPDSLTRLVWHESAHGRETIDNHSHMGMVYATRHAESLASITDKLRRQVAQLEADLLEARTAAAKNEPRRFALNDSIFQRA